jgi:hypothetical protein
MFVAIAPAAASATDSTPCASPVSDSTIPTGADALSILRSAVGISGPCDAKPCACDPSGNGEITVSDAIRTLKASVGHPVELICDCTPATCVGARLHFLEGSNVDLGWTGIHHDQALPSGWSLDLEIVHRCGGSGAVCEDDDECGGSGCVATCDCAGDRTCELRLAGTGRHCLTTMKDCNTNSDCPIGVACTDFFAPPISQSAGGAPFCWQAHIVSPFVAMADLATGELTISTNVRVRAALGIQLDQPCPRCGSPDEAPTPGHTFQCEGGQFPQQECTVDAVHPLFGGTSYDCPPNLSLNVTGLGQFVHLDVTTGTQSRTAQLPCANLNFRANPLNAPATPGKCLDDASSCTSNADCRRCTGDHSIACDDDADCGEGGSCAEAPDQPISCGYWCHCGFCDGQPDLPCMDDSQCSEGQQCRVGSGTGSAPNVPQQRPNDCSMDGFVCGGVARERCETTELGHCQDTPYRSCTRNSDTCQPGNDGECVLSERRCFEPRIVRTGAASAFGSFCANNGSACSTDADCGGAECVSDSIVADGVSIGCMGATSSSAINNVVGITGPAVFGLRTQLEFQFD